MTPKAVRLSDIADLLSGGTPSKSRSDFWSGDIPWISAKDMKVSRLADSQDHISQDGLNAGSRLAPAKATLILTRGMTLLTDVPICSLLRPCAFNQDVKAVVPRDGINPEYLTYSLIANRPALLSSIELAGHGTGRLPTDILKALEIRLPSRSEQDAIASVLSTLDDRIEINRTMSTTLEAIARALFKSWFLDFEPVRARAEGRDTGLPPHIAGLFPNQFEDSELGQVPKGWLVDTISSIADVAGGGTPSTKGTQYWNGANFWATPKDMAKLEFPVLLETERKITDAGVSQIASGLLAPGTVLLSSRAPIGYLAITKIPTAINQGFIAMKPREGIPSAFLLLWAEASEDEILSRANGSTFLEISKSNFRTIRLVVPSRPAFRAFGEVAEALYDRIATNEAESRTLEHIRDLLLPKLIAGEIPVRDAEKILVDVA